MRLGAALAVLCTLLLSACSDSSDPPVDPRPPAATAPAGGGPPPTGPLARARCPASLSNCKTASGRIIYVERVDPDGDGDAHFVLASGDSITAPGISVIDVAVDLRPHPLPGPGDAVSAAGPVQTGSYGQSQIHAVEVRIGRRQ